MPQKNVAFVQVPGGFSLGAFFHKTTAKLTQLGYDAVEINNPTVVDTDKLASFYDDAAHVHDGVEQFLDQGKDVVLIGNSYGGFVITEASRGLSKADRNAAGKDGALVHLFYLSSLFAPIGVTGHEMTGGNIPVDTTSPNDFIGPPAAATVKVLVGSLSEDEQKHYDNLLRPQSAKAFSDKMTYAGYLHIPTTIVIGERDECVPTSLMHQNVDAVIAKGQADIRKISLPNAEHCMMVTQPDEVMNILMDIVSRS